MVVDGVGKLFNELLETMDFQRGTHDDEHVWLLVEIAGLNCAYVVTERMRFIIQDDGRAEGADASGASGTRNTSFTYWSNMLVSSLCGARSDLTS